MAVCQYFLRGTCKFGNNCRNSHDRNAAGGTFGNQSWANPRNTKTTAAITADMIKQELATEKPMWPLTVYAAAKTDLNLIGGLDESPEELRVRATTAQQAGNVAEYITYEEQKTNLAGQAYQNMLANIDEAVKRANELNAQGDSTTSTTSAFGTNPTTSAFGQPATTSTFGQPAFGQPTSVFGQGSQPTSTFGQPSQPTSSFGQPPTTTSPFGQPQQATSAFGQPAQTTSTFGKPAQTTSAFGQSQPSTSAFGQASAFGQTSQASSFIKPATGAFGNLGSSNTTSAFGGGGGFSAFASQPSSFGTSAAAQPTFGRSALGQNSTTQPTPALGQTSTTQPASAFGNPPNATSPFGNGSASGNPASTPSTFGNAPNPASTSAFGGAANMSSTSAFGAPSAFGVLAQQDKPSAFGGSSGLGFNAPTSNGFTNPNSSVGSPFAGTQSSNNSGGFGNTGSTLQVPSAFSGPPSAFPMSSPSASASGAPDFVNAKSKYKPGSTPYDLTLPADYKSQLPSTAREAFESEKFEWGKIPDWIPPLELR